MDSLNAFGVGIGAIGVLVILVIRVPERLHGPKVINSRSTLQQRKDGGWVLLGEAATILGFAISSYSALTA